MSMDAAQRRNLSSNLQTAIEDILRQLPTFDEAWRELRKAYVGLLSPDPYISSPVYASIAVVLVVVLILIACLLYQQIALCIHEASLGDKPSEVYVKMQRQASFQRRARKSATPSEPVCHSSSNGNSSARGYGAGHGSPSAPSVVVSAVTEPELPPPTPAHVSLARQKSFERRKKKATSGAADMV